MICSVEKIVKKYSDIPVLNQCSFVINEKEKWGIVGINGAGKSTLLKIIAGLEQPDEGTVTVVPSKKIASLVQNRELEPQKTVLQTVLDSVNKKDEFEEFEVKSILTKLNMNNFDQKIETCSGGQKRRVALACALVQPCDLLILDEPTNHLDQEMIGWLEQRLKKMSKALLMVTHDRYFLDRVTTQIAEIEGGTCYAYECNYSGFLLLKAQREEMAKSTQRKRESYLRKEAQWIARGAQARSTKSKERIERFEQQSAIEKIQDKQKLQLGALATRLGNKTVEIEHLTKSLGGKLLIEDFSYIVRRHERLGIIGPNGSGKTTLMRLLIGELQPDEGHIVLGETVKIGYFSQELEEMDPSMRIIDFVRQHGEIISTPQGDITAAMMLERFLFTPKQQWQPLGKCSGGEKRRLGLLGVLMQAPNILLLDEPTNDLDIDTLMIVEDFLDEFDGAMLVVSHDRYFLDRTCDHLLIYGEQGKLSFSNLSYSDYLDESSNTKAEVTTTSNETRQVNRKVKLSYQEKKELEAIEPRLQQLEDEIVMLDEKLATTQDFAVLSQLSKQRSDSESEMETLTERWMELSEKES